MAYGTLNAGTITPGSGNTLTINEIVDGTAIKDEDAMGSNSATHLATQQSIKAYVDSAATQATTAAQGVGTGDSPEFDSTTLKQGTAPIMRFDATTVVASGGTLAEIKAYGANGGQRHSSTIKFVAGATPNLDTVAGNIEFWVATTGVGQVPVLRAKVNYNGDFYTNDGSVSSLSDSRLKSSIKDLDDGLDILIQLRPVTFKYNQEDGLAINDGVTRYGFIADEVLEVAPNYVQIDEGEINGESVDDLKSMAQMRMFPMVVKAIQELSAKNDALEARILTLESKVV